MKNLFKFLSSLLVATGLTVASCSLIHNLNINTGSGSNKITTNEVVK